MPTYLPITNLSFAALLTAAGKANNMSLLRNTPYYDVSGNTYNDATGLNMSNFFGKTFELPGPIFSLSVFAGSGNYGKDEGIGTAASFTTPNGICIDSTKTILYVTCYDSLGYYWGGVRKITINNSNVTNITPNTLVNDVRPGAQGIITDSVNNVLYINSTEGFLHKITVPAYTITNESIGSIPVTNMYTIGIDYLNNIYIGTPSAIYKNTILIAGSTTLGYIDGPGTSARFNSAQNSLKICIDSNNNLYVSEGNFNRIRKIDTSYNVTTFAGSTSGASGFINGIGIAARFDSTGGMCIDSSDNIYVIDRNNLSIRKITMSGIVTTFYTNNIIGGAWDICTDNNGKFYLTHQFHQRIYILQ